MSGKKLTDKQQRFVEEYLIDLNATQAAIRAGYSKKTAEVIGYENLRKPQITEAICKAKKKISQKLEITAERVLLERARLAYQNKKDLYNEDGTLKQIHELDDDTAAAIHGVKIGSRIVKDDDGNEKLETFIKSVKTYDKDKSLTALEKYLGLYEKDNEQKGEANLKTAGEFMAELLKAVNGSSLGLPAPVGDAE